MSDAGDPGEFDSAQAGKQLADPNEMSTKDSDQIDAQSEKNGEAPGVAINGFGGLYPRMTDVDSGTVLSLRNGQITAYRVNISSLECEKRDGTSCEDLEYNCSGQQVCDHLAAAIYSAPRKPDVNAKAIDGATGMLSMAKDAAQSAQSTADSLRAARNAHAQASAQQASQNGSQPAEDESMNAEDAYDGYDLEDLRGELREALKERDFDVNEMGTGTYQGTDQIKFSVSHEDFDYLKRKTSECDMVGYDGDMNAIDAGDVEDFIKYEL
jgi:pyruvate/2-oxoglutarate dehydrogenase complex dihydrolipoamide acyltransferase (E2) component